MNIDANPAGLIYAVRMVLAWMFYITIWNGVKYWLGDVMLDNLGITMFGPYIEVWDKHKPDLPLQDNPFIQMMIGILLCGLLFNFVSLGRMVAAGVAAFFLWGFVFSIISSSSNFAPSPLLFGGGIGSIIFLIVSSFMGDAREKRGQSGSAGGLSRLFNWMRS